MSAEPSRPPDAVPEKVREAWAAAHERLQAQMEFFLQEAASGTIYGELHLDGGVPRRWEFAPVMRPRQVGTREATLQARRRK